MEDKPFSSDYFFLDDKEVHKIAESPYMKVTQDQSPWSMGSSAGYRRKAFEPYEGEAKVDKAITGDCFLTPAQRRKLYYDWAYHGAEEICDGVIGKMTTNAEDLRRLSDKLSISLKKHLERYASSDRIRVIVWTESEDSSSVTICPEIYVEGQGWLEIGAWFDADLLS